jgi:WD40 repeat protein
MFTLYAPNTCALASHIALVDAGAPYALKLVDFGKTEQRQPDYLKVNPKARVPSLVTPRGILTETPAMLAFIAQGFPAAKLAPLDDAFAFAEVFSPDGSRIVTASVDKTARIWDAASAKEIAVLRGHEDVVVSAAFSPDGSRIVTASGDNTARFGTFSTASTRSGHAER